MRLLASTALLFIALSISARANEKRDEDYYNLRWCAAQLGESAQVLEAQRGHRYEHRMPDGGRADCVLPEYAIEADWAKALKPEEGIGQAARYAQQLGLKPGLLLIVTEQSHCSKLERAKETLEGVWVRVGDAMYQIRLWTTGGYQCEEDESR